MCVCVCVCVFTQMHMWVSFHVCIYTLFVVCILSVYCTSVMRESNSLGAAPPDRFELLTRRWRYC